MCWRTQRAGPRNSGPHRLPSAPTGLLEKTCWREDPGQGVRPPDYRVSDAAAVSQGHKSPQWGQREGPGDITGHEHLAKDVALERSHAWMLKGLGASAVGPSPHSKEAARGWGSCWPVACCSGAVDC